VHAVAGMLAAILLTMPATAPAAAASEPVRTQPANLTTTQPFALRRPLPDATLLALLRHAAAAAPTALPSDDLLLDAHRQIEIFFDQPALRKVAAKHLAGMGLDANLLGRLIPVRDDWPALVPGIYFIDERHGSWRARYWLIVPDGYDRSQPWPALLDLPDAIEQPAAHKAPAQPTAAPAFDTDSAPYQAMAEQTAQQYPGTLIIVPLPDPNAGLGPGRIGMSCAMAALDDAASLADIDVSHVSVSGHAIAGAWAWNLALHEPTYFAAIAVFGSDAGTPWLRTRMPCLRNALTVLWHDTADRDSKVAEAQKDVEVLKRFGCDVQYLQTTGSGPQTPAEVANRVAALLRERQRELYPKTVSIQSMRIEPIFNRADWVQIDQPTNGGLDSHILAARGSEVLHMYGNTFRVDATRGDNRFELTTDNVAGLRLLVNDQMIDFARPVVVLVNHIKRFDGMVRPDVGVMLADQLFLGRGWRYFTAQIELDLAGTAAPQPATHPR
jgi:hypothetical protein